VAGLSISGVVMAILLKLAGYSTPGWFSVALGILVLMLLQTGALALMTLMLTGVVRSGTVATTLAYKEFVEQVLESRPVPAA
jgi:polyisoprenyl-phosphate glycosyltransferase